MYPSVPTSTRQNDVFSNRGRPAPSHRCERVGGVEHARHRGGGPSPMVPIGSNGMRVGSFEGRLVPAASAVRSVSCPRLCYGTELARVTRTRPSSWANTVPATDLWEIMVNALDGGLASRSQSLRTLVRVAYPPIARNSPSAGAHAGQGTSPPPTRSTSRPSRQAERRYRPWTTRPRCSAALRSAERRAFA